MYIKKPLQIIIQRVEEWKNTDHDLVLKKKN